MTISATPRRNDYVGNGSTIVFDYDFKLYSSNDVRVIVGDAATPQLVFADLVLGVDFTIDGIGDDAGGQVTLINAAQAWMTAGFLTNLYTITILGARVPVQASRIRDQGPFRASSIEDMVDKQAILIQELAEQLSRAILLGSTSTVTGVTIGPAVPLQFIRWDATGTFLEAAVPGSFSRVSDEVPAGSINGVNAAFTIANTPLASSFSLYKNGLKLVSGGVDYTRVGLNITMTVAPMPGEVLVAAYEY